MAEENEIDLENPAIKAAIATAVEASVSGLKTKNSELLGKLKETSGKLTQFETQFEGIDIDAVKGLLSRAGQDEETKLLTEGKVDEVFNRRTERLRGDYDKQLKTISERAEKAESFAAKFQGKVLGDSVRGAALKAGALPKQQTTSSCAPKACSPLTKMAMQSPLMNPAKSSSVKTARPL